MAPARAIAESSSYTWRGTRGKSLGHSGPVFSLPAAVPALTFRARWVGAAGVQGTDRPSPTCFWHVVSQRSAEKRRVTACPSFWALRRPNQAAGSGRRRGRGLRGSGPGPRPGASTPRSLPRASHSGQERLYQHEDTKRVFFRAYGKYFFPRETHFIYMAKTHSAVHRPFRSLRRAPAEEERDSSTH